jgi:hypothetical protein
VEKVSSGDGVAAGVGEVTRAHLCRGEVNKREDAATAGGRGELIERGGECCPRTTSCAQAGTTSHAEVRRSRSCHVWVLFSNRGEPVF